MEISPCSTETIDISALRTPGDQLMDLEYEAYNQRIAFVIGLGLPNISLLKDCAPAGSLALVCGSGPSIKSTLPRIRAAKDQGAIIFAVNSCHDFLVENGIIPHFGVMLDPNERVATYQTPRKDVRYIIGASVHHAVWRRFRESGIRPFWFVPIARDDHHHLIMERHPTSDPQFLSGATTVGLRTINLVRQLGFQDIEGHGFDSCYPPGEGPLHAHHKPHVYGDKREAIITSKTDGSKFTFISNGAMYRQAFGLNSMLRVMNETETNGRVGGVRLLIDGDGAIPWMAWKDGGPQTYVEHRDPERMFAKYGNSKHFDYTKDRAV